MNKQIGWFILKEDTEYCDRGYECAAWYENILVKAGRYPIEAPKYREREDGRIEAHVSSASIPLDGTITSDYFGTLYFGMPVGIYDEEKNKGKKSTYHMRPYLHSLAKHILSGCDEYELLPEYEAREIKFDWDGEEHTTYGIFRREA